jgi:hypothetical protein
VDSHAGNDWKKVIVLPGFKGGQGFLTKTWKYLNLFQYGSPDGSIYSRDGIVIKSGIMKTRIYSNEVEAPLTRFIGNFLGNVCVGITMSLRTPQPVRTLKYELEGENVRLEVNNEKVPMNLNSGFSKVIVSNTIRGMVRRLKLSDPDGMIRIEVDVEAWYCNACFHTDGNPHFISPRIRSLRLSSRRNRRLVRNAG